MSHEVTIPLLPCACLDDIVAFYEVLGFHTTYRQRKVYRAEVAMVLDDPATAAEILARVDNMKVSINRVELSPEAATRAAAAFETAADLVTALP